MKGIPPPKQIAKYVLVPLLAGQAYMALRRMPQLPEPDGPREGVYGEGPPLRLLIGGDSSAAGVGVQKQEQALSGRLVEALAQRLPVQVQWSLIARSGVTSEEALALLIAEAPPGLVADLAVFALGVNDVVNQVALERAVRARAAIRQRLREVHGVRHVVFTALPPVHQFPGLPRPLRWVVGAAADAHNRALARWAATQPDVSHLPMPIKLNREVMAIDGFHPGEPAYRMVADTLAEYIASRVWPQLHDTAEPVAISPPRPAP